MGCKIENQVHLSKTRLINGNYGPSRRGESSTCDGRIHGAGRGVASKAQWLKAACHVTEEQYKYPRPDASNTGCGEYAAIYILPVHDLCLDSDVVLFVIFFHFYQTCMQHKYRLDVGETVTLTDR